MSQDLDFKIRKMLTRYLNGGISRTVFQNWLDPHLWDIEKIADIPTQHLAYGIELCFAEFEAGHWSEAELKEQLRPFVRSVTRLFNRDRFDWTKYYATSMSRVLVEKYSDVAFSSRATFTTTAARRVRSDGASLNASREAVFV